MVRFKVKRTKADETLAKLAGSVKEQMNAELRRFGAQWERNVKSNFGPGGRNAQGGPRVRARTGALRRSVGFRLLASQNAVMLTVGDRATPYAGLQEYGGTVRPTRGKYLTIPLPTAKTSAGALSGSYRLRPGGLRRGRNGRVRRVFKTDKGETFIFRSKQGNLIIGVKREGTKFDPKRDSIYILKKEVKVPPRLGAWDAARFSGPHGEATFKGFEKAAIRGVKNA